MNGRIAKQLRRVARMKSSRQWGKQRVRIGFGTIVYHKDSFKSVYRALKKTYRPLGSAAPCPF